MQLASTATRTPHLLHALEALAQRPDNHETGLALAEELSGITVLVAKKFTNDRTADGLLEAYYLTIGCVSLAISQANIPESNEAKLNFLLHHGAEYVFQMGFRHIKELSSLPYVAYLSDFENDAFVQQRNLKLLFTEICRADPGVLWTGEHLYQSELQKRRENQQIIDCALWLRKNHYAGPIRDSDLDAHAVIAIAVIFAIAGDAPIVARAKQKDIETLILGIRKHQLNIDKGWTAWLRKIPETHQKILYERMDEFRNTIARKILSQASIKKVIFEIQENYAGSEQDIDYS